MKTQMIRHHGSVHLKAEERLNRIIAGALTSTIAAHGQINSRLIGSAVKRIKSQLVAQYPEILEAIDNHGNKVQKPTWHKNQVEFVPEAGLIQLRLPLFPRVKHTRR